MKPKILQNLLSFKTKIFVLFFLLLSVSAAFGQFNVTEVITDYAGYWKSSSTAVNTIKPDNTHNLLSFSFMGTRYSTGVNDLLLSVKGLSFVPGDYRSLPITSIGSAVTSNTKIGLGYLLDGILDGPSIPSPANDIPYYLTDGIKGLNLGTCVANLPSGTMFFPVSKILLPAIGDGAPDMVVTQVGDPSGSMDRYSFTDINGAQVGNYVDIKLNNIDPVGNWTADFYEASQHPMTLLGGFTKTDRPIRLWASDLSTFGINSTNASRVAYFKIMLSGNSDVAFVAYNNNAINIFSSLLPVKLDNFSAKETGNTIQLNWKTLSEINSDAFVVERSIDGTSFETINKVKASGNTGIVQEYTCADKNPVNGKNYYRLKMVDKDGNSDNSKVILVTVSSQAGGSISVYPNPAKNYITINHPFAGSNEQLQVVNLQGSILIQKKVIAASFQTRLDVSELSKGIYELVWTNGKDVWGNRMVIQ